MVRAGVLNHFSLMSTVAVLFFASEHRYKIPTTSTDYKYFKEHCLIQKSIRLRTPGLEHAMKERNLHIFQYIFLITVFANPVWKTLKSYYN
jgi:hypothetical protein